MWIRLGEALQTKTDRSSAAGEGAHRVVCMKIHSGGPLFVDTEGEAHSHPYGWVRLCGQTITEGGGPSYLGGRWPLRCPQPSRKWRMNWVCRKISCILTNSIEGRVGEK